MRFLFPIALRNLLAARRRTALLGTAVGLVTMMLVLLMSLSRGITDNMVEAATTLSAGHVNVAGFYKPSAGTAAPIITRTHEIRAVVEEVTPGIDYIVERHRGWGKLISETGAVQSGLTGIVVDEEQRFFEKLQLAKESDFVEGGSDTVAGDARRLAEPDTIVLFANQARRLGVGVGDIVTISTETSAGMTNTADLEVVAVARDLGFLSSWSTFVPKQVVLDLYQLNDDTTGALWVYLDDIDQAKDAMGTLRVALIEGGWTVREHEPLPFFFKFDTIQSEDWVGQQLDLTIWRDEVSFLTWIITGFDTVSWLLIGVLVVIIAVGIMNSMWNAVRERTREIGTMRAIGMTRSAVLALFMIEAMLLGIGATATGAAVGWAIATGVDAARIPVPSEAAQAVLLSDTLHLVASPVALAVSVLVLSFLTSLAALWPAVRAARLRPVQALSHAE